MTDKEEVVEADSAAASFKGSNVPPQKIIDKREGPEGERIANSITLSLSLSLTSVLFKNSLHSLYR